MGHWSSTIRLKFRVYLKNVIFRKGCLSWWRGSVTSFSATGWRSARSAVELGDSLTQKWRNSRGRETDEKRRAKSTGRVHTQGDHTLQLGNMEQSKEQLKTARQAAGGRTSTGAILFPGDSEF